ncbi:MAG: prolyl oligopeptidase family serine peptidase [Bacteroidota bacterium]
MKKFSLGLLFTSFCLLLWSQKYEPVEAKSITVIDWYFNKNLVADKYRWLEDVSDTATLKWVEKQNNSSRKYLNCLPNSTDTYNTIKGYSVVEYEHACKNGEYYFQMTYTDPNSSPSLYYSKKLGSEMKELVNPREISKKDNIVISFYEVSKDSRLLAYEFSRNGSDWGEIMVAPLNQKGKNDDHLTNVKFSTIAWLGNGFFYSTFAQDGQFGVTSRQRVLYHRIGDPQTMDTLVFERKNNPTTFFRYITTSDERFFVMQEMNVKKGILNIYYIDYQSDYKWIRPLMTNLKSESVEILDHHNGKFIALVRLQQHDNNIAEIDPADPYKWKLIGSEFSDAFLQEVIPLKDRIIAVYQANQQPAILVYDYDGLLIGRFTTPYGSSVNGFSGNSGDEELLFNFQSYTIPPIVYKLNTQTLKMELTEKTSVTFDFKDIEYKMVEYHSKDSVLVPMVLVYEKGIRMDGKNPLILNAYGGFNIVDPPAFDEGIVYFIKKGGIFAFANIRGGGDKGINWAKAGRGKNKQTSFDDFIAAAEYLIANKYTCKEKLASTGASNGGLVVAAAAIQRPDLFRVVVPEVAPLDMLRFEKFTIGQYWKGEYGTVSDSADFLRLLAYSPYHNINENTNYPSMLILTAENDDRVPPFHSYKFAARLQNRKAQTNPILLFSRKKEGHNGAATYTTSLEEESEIYRFILNEVSKN